MIIPDELVQMANKVKDECVIIAGILSRESERVSLIEKTFLAMNNILGALAFFVVSFAPINDHMPDNLQDSIIIFAAMALVLGPYLQSALIKDPPSRFRDYSRYIRSYASKIEGQLADVKSKNRYEKLIELIQLAETNIIDAKTEWPKLLSS